MSISRVIGFALACLALATVSLWIGPSFDGTAADFVLFQLRLPRVLVGALVGACTGAALASLWYLPALPLSHALPLGLFAGATGQMGDLVESLLKRSTGIKDSGGIVPGHGGMLDRIDALIVVSPIVYLYASYSGLIH